MSITLGKIIWFFSFLIFLGVFYDFSIFDRIKDLFTQDGGIIYVDSIGVSDFMAERISERRESVAVRSSSTGVLGALKPEFSDSAESIIDELLSSGGVSGLSVGDVIEEPPPPEPIVDYEKLCLEIERIKWEKEKLDERLEKLEASIAKLEGKKDRIFDDLIALVATASPFMVPIITSRLTDHKKQIKLGRKK